MSGTVFLVLASCSSVPGICDDPGACKEPDAEAGGGDLDGGGDADVIQPPVGCDATADPKDAPKCVVSEFGVFVDGASGRDANAGTRESPVKSIGAALGKLGGKSRVYVCEGTYAEHVKLTSAVSLYGGFACRAWTYSGAKPKIAPADKGYAIHIEKTGAALIVADLEVIAQDGAAPGDSSIAVFLSESKEVKLRRVKATAGKGMAVADAPEPASNLFSETMADLDGTAAAGGTGGPAKICACKAYGSSTGGKGGNGGNPAPNGENGASTPPAAPMPPRTSAGGDGYTAAIGFCTPGRAGADGTPRAAGKGAEKHGELNASGWAPAIGLNGDASNPGGGAGGGGGGNVNGSGGGGCGGCGGAGGIGGKGGGASISLASYASVLIIEASVLTSSSAGTGGKASKGGGGGGGGGGGAVGACGGGQGGNGAGGGGGGGGAGGIAAGILHARGTVTVDGATQTTLGQAGIGGAAGELGAGGSNALGTAQSGVAGGAGKDGVAQATLDVTP